MSIRFAAPLSALRNRMDSAEQYFVSAKAANDNAPRHTDRATLHAALRHFAQHGLDAAARARVQAEQAKQIGDKQSADYWTEICRALDRRMARRLEQKCS